MGHRSFLHLALLAAALASTSACASSGYVNRRPAPIEQANNRAYRNGYDAGRIDGADDARRGQRFNYQNSRVYRSADRGYDGYGNRRSYQGIFREGYAAGYTDGYRRYDRPARPPVFDRGRGPAPAAPLAVSRAADQGYRDGFEQGRNDARDGDRYDPIRAKRYREGDHGYESRDGSRDNYKRDYRSAFQRGYEQGYKGPR